MPSGLLNADTTFPNVEGKRTEQALNEIINYLYMLLENLKYSLANLDKDNFNDKGFEDMAKIINKPVLVELKNTNGEVLKLTIEAGRLSSEISNANGEISEIKQTVNGIHLGVSNGYESSTIQLFVNGVAISSQEIELNGMVTFNSLSTPGETVINGGNITTGTIRAIDISGCNFDVNLTSSGSNGRIRFVDFTSQYGEVGEIDVDRNGEGSQYEASNRIFFSSYKGFALKLRGAGGLSLETPKSMYLGADGDIVAEANNIYLRGDVHIGTETLEDYIKRIAKQ